jgi:hypothetical protein
LDDLPPWDEKSSLAGKEQATRPIARRTSPDAPIAHQHALTLFASSDYFAGATTGCRSGRYGTSTAFGGGVVNG